MKWWSSPGWLWLGWEDCKRVDDQDRKRLNVAVDKPGDPLTLQATETDTDTGIDTETNVDIEFVVQYLVLAHAHAHPSLTEFTDNVRILDAVEQAELLPASAAGRLREAYLALRAEWHRSVLDIPDRARAAETLARYRDDVEQIRELVFAPARG